MIKLYVEHNSAGSRWRLVSRTERGADLIARSGSPRPDDTAALAQLALLCADVPPLIVSDGGHWQWILAGPDGTVAAESPAVYRDRTTCRHAFAEARRAARMVVGRRPAGTPNSTRHRGADRSAQVDSGRNDHAGRRWR